MGVGVVVRDEGGRVVAALAKVFPYVDNPTVAETLAAWHAVFYAVIWGYIVQALRAIP